MNLHIRPAVLRDAGAIARIYNAGIRSGNATFETRTVTVEDRRRWIEQQDEHHPILVAETEGQVVGWASVQPYRARDCYRGVGEFSIYVDESHQGKGIGKHLLQALVEACARRGYWKLVSRIFDFNHASRALCRACGFREVGVYEKHGKQKVDGWHRGAADRGKSGLTKESYDPRCRENKKRASKRKPRSLAYSPDNRFQPLFRIHSVRPGNGLHVLTAIPQTYHKGRVG